MGSPVSVVLANIVMKYIKGQALQTSPSSTVFLETYVDDVLSAVVVDQINEMLAYINSIDCNIQFT